MRCVTLGLLIAAAVCLGAAIALSGANNSPVGTWQVSISGSDRGVTFLTFSNDFTFAGYGISQDALGPFTIAGTWEFDSKGRIVGGYTQFIEGGSTAGILRGSIVGNGRLQARVKTTEGPEKFRAPAPAASPDLAGAWAGKTRQPGENGLTSFTLTASTNMPGWFDLTGTGIDSGGSFTMSGAVLVTSDRRVGAYTVSDFGTATQTASFAGKLARKGKKLVLIGKNDDRQRVKLLAERP